MKREVSESAFFLRQEPLNESSGLTLQMHNCADSNGWWPQKHLRRHTAVEGSSRCGREQGTWRTALTDSECKALTLAMGKLASSHFGEWKPEIKTQNYGWLHLVATRFQTCGSCSKGSDSNITDWSPPESTHLLRLHSTPPKSYYWLVELDQHGSRLCPCRLSTSESIDTPDQNWK